jgi:hypothetical protein
MPLKGIGIGGVEKVLDESVGSAQSSGHLRLNRRIRQNQPFGATERRYADEDLTEVMNS